MKDTTLRYIKNTLLRETMLLARKYHRLDEMDAEEFIRYCKEREELYSHSAILAKILNDNTKKPEIDEGYQE